MAHQQGRIMSQKSYVVATVKPWNIDVFHERHTGLPGSWHLMQSKEELSADRIREIGPRYVFFPHWSWKVPPEIFEHVECVCFHMTDLPFGRGGSPLQNLISRGFKETKMSAIRMEDGMDTGPIYMKRPLGLDGSAEEIFRRAGSLVWDMITEMVKTEPECHPQSGDGEVFTRRTPDESALPASCSLSELYDHIRMLDAPTYPRAYLKFGEWRLEFSSAKHDKDGLTVQVKIMKDGTE